MISFLEAQGHYNMNVVAISKVLLKYYKFQDQNHVLEYLETLLASRSPLLPNTPKEVMVAVYFTRYWREVLEHLDSLGLKPKEDKSVIKYSN